MILKKLHELINSFNLLVAILRLSISVVGHATPGTLEGEASIKIDDVGTGLYI